MIPCQGQGAETRGSQLLFICAGAISMKGVQSWGPSEASGASRASAPSFAHKADPMLRTTTLHRNRTSDDEQQ